MRSMTVGLVLTAAAVLAPPGQAQRETPAPAGRRLADMPWTDAERLLTAATVVVIPLGAGSKEHGPHLRLRNDETLAEYLTQRVVDRAAVIVAPTLTYHYYPAFLEYPGSTSLSLATARDMTTEVVRSLARYGPRRFYVLNTGMSTVRPLEAAARTLAAEGILMRFTSLDAHLEAASRKVARQEGGSHADEVETSMMLHIDPAAVDMTKAVKDYGPRSNPFTLTRQAGGTGTWSPSGIWGDPTLATAEKGRVLVDALVAGVLGDIENLRAASMPIPSVTAPPATAPAQPGPARPAGPPDRCSPGDERSIRGIGDAYTAFWANADAERLASLWTRGGDFAHPDGFVERTSLVIRQNRAALFAQREYRSTRHPLTVAAIRCLTNDIAIADGKWELRGVRSSSGDLLPTTQGLCTMVVRRTAGTWQIEAYRYTITPAGAAPPTLLRRPGYPGRGGL
jgi:creatinine amidohydrolase